MPHLKPHNLPLSLLQVLITALQTRPHNCDGAVIFQVGKDALPNPQLAKHDGVVNDMLGGPKVILIDDDENDDVVSSPQTSAAEMDRRSSRINRGTADRAKAEVAKFGVSLFHIKSLPTGCLTLFTSLMTKVDGVEPIPSTEDPTKATIASPARDRNG